MAFRWLPLLLVLVAALPAAGGTPTLEVEVISIGDGDTIHVHRADRAIAQA